MRWWLPTEPHPPSYHLGHSPASAVATPTLMLNLLNTKQVRYAQQWLKAKKALDG